MGRWKGRIWHGSTVRPVECTWWVGVLLTACQTFIRRLTLRICSVSERFSAEFCKRNWFCSTTLRSVKKNRVCKKNRATFSSNLKQDQNQSWFTYTSFPAVSVGYMHFLRVLIGSLDARCLLWLARVITLRLVLRQSIENCTNVKTWSSNWWFSVFPSWLYLSMYWNCTEYSDADLIMERAACLLSLRLTV